MTEKSDKKNDKRKGGHVPLFPAEKFNIKQNKAFLLCVVIFCISAIAVIGYIISDARQRMIARETQQNLQEIKESAETTRTNEIQYDENAQTPEPIIEEQESIPEMLPQYESLYDINNHLIGWLFIEGTVIDYPVMQTPDDENYYLELDFNKQPNKNGSLIMDTDSVVGSGTKSRDYQDGTAPSTNLIIHGHTMKSGEMFGDLQRYAEEEYGKNHSIIGFDSLYEEREYELISVFYSQVFYETDDVFKFYKFFQADTQEEFDDWYGNIKKMSLYDTGVEAQLGDEFITLSCCAYHVEDGRFVVVGKRKR